MKPALILALGIASTVALVSAHAQTYQWKDAGGRTVISDTPPPTSAKGARTLGGKAQALVSEAPEKGAETPVADAPKSTSEKDLEFKKRQLEAKEKASKESSEQTAAREKQENCSRARGNLAALEADQPLAIFNEKGERQALDTAQRQQEIERTRRFLAETCN